MRSIATDVARSVVCVLVWFCVVLDKRMSCVKTGEPIEMPFWGPSHVGQGTHIINGGQDRMDLSAATRGDKPAMRPFAARFFFLLQQ